MGTGKHKHNKKGGGNGGGGGEAAPVTDDPRFASMHSAPTFQRIPKDERRFRIDPRFKAVLTDDRFRAIDGQYDKYGRKMKKDRRVVDDLSAFYKVDEEEDEEEQQQQQQQQQQKQPVAKGKKGKKGEKEKEEVGDARFRLKAGMQEEEESDASSSGSDDVEEEGEGEQKGAGGGKGKAVSRNEMEERLEYLNRLARGEASDASVSTSDSSGEGEEEEEEEGSDDDEEEGGEGEGEGMGIMDPRQLEEGPVPMGEATKRLAIMNVDWDHLKAVDLLGVLLSFTPASGRVARVTVYRSDYGMERLAEEARLGPGFLLSRGKKEGEEKGEEEEGKGSSSSGSGSGSGSDEDDDDDDDDDDEEEEEEEEEGQEGEGEEVDQEQLRAYEIQRLRYHFAVAECDSVGTASALYEEVDGLEFEASAAQLDARFVPDDVTFEGRPVRDAAEAPLPSNYEPPSFVTRALQQTKVECTWDMGDEERERKLTSYHKWREMDDDDLGVYLASSSSSEGEGEEGMEGEGQEGKGKKEEKRRRLRSLLLGGLVGEEEEEDGEEEEGKEFTYVPGQLGRQKWERRQQEKEKEKEGEGEEGETPFEALLRKRREKRRRRRQQEEAKQEGEDDFFVGGGGEAGKKGKTAVAAEEEEEGEEAAQEKKRDAELELLFAGEDKEEAQRDFDMRAVARVERMKGKKLKGKRRRKEAERAEAAPGMEFAVDTGDARFAALFEGRDARFGIDRTAREFRETEGMRTILGEQAKRRRTSKKEELQGRDVVAAAVAEPRRVGSVGVLKGGKEKGAKGEKRSLAALAQRFKGKM